MALLTDMRDYLRRYGSATVQELVREFNTTEAMIESVGETLKAKGLARCRKVRPSSGCCGGSCGTAAGCGEAGSNAVMLWEWTGKGKA